MSEILRTEDAMTKAGARALKIFRPPFGMFSWNTVAAAKELGYKLIMWTTLTGDFRRDWPEEKVCATALTKLSEGAILVFHDNELTQSRIAPLLKDVIARIQNLGFSFQSIQ